MADLISATALFQNKDNLFKKNLFRTLSGVLIL